MLAVGIFGISLSMHSTARTGIQLLVASSREDGGAFKGGAFPPLKQAKAPVLYCINISCTFVVKTDLDVFWCLSCVVKGR